jgi:glycosyltransferase involved in cell wall biosynthesis
MKNTKLRVLFILENLAGCGAERVTLNLLRHLDRERFESTLFLLERRGPLFSEVPVHVRLMLAHKFRSYNKYLTPYYLTKLIAPTRRSDVIIAALEFRPTYLAYMAAALTKRPVIGVVNTLLGQWLMEWGRWHSYAVKLVYPRLTGVVCVSNSVAQSLSKVTRLEPEKVRIIYNSHEIDAIIEKGREKPPQWYIDILEKPTLIASGQLRSLKGFDILIKAHAKLLQRGINHNLVIIGSGPLRNQLEDLANHLRVADSVFMPGYILDPYPLIKNATAFVLSSHHEGLAGVIIEALALGTPVVATACGGTTEVLLEGRYGVLVTPGDVCSLADGMAKILSDGSLREKLSKSGIERARFFSPENRVPQWEQLLEEICGHECKNYC